MSGHSVLHNVKPRKVRISVFLENQTWYSRDYSEYYVSVVSAIGSEKKQKMSFATTEQDTPNPNQPLSKTAGVVYSVQEVSAVDTVLFNYFLNYRDWLKFSLVFIRHYFSYLWIFRKKCKNIRQKNFVERLDLLGHLQCVPQVVRYHRVVRSVVYLCCV